MPLQITGRQMDVTARQKDYIAKKVERLRRLCPKFDELKFTLSQEKLAVQVDASVKAGKIVAKATASDAEPLAAIDIVTDKIEAQLTKVKSKQAGHKVHRDYKGEITSEEIAAIDAEEETEAEDEAAEA